MTSYSLQMYGPDYWKSWTREAVEGTEAAMTELLAADHAEQVGYRACQKVSSTDSTLARATLCQHWCPCARAHWPRTCTH